MKLDGNTKTKVSVALATYNGATYLEELLDSLLKQSLQPFEIVVVDDCSSDKTLQILEAYQTRYTEIKIHVNEYNLGPVGSFKKAISKCHGNYYALCDQDDIWLENKLELSIQALLTSNNLSKPSLVYSDLKLINMDGEIISESFWKLLGMDPKRENLYTIFFGNVVTGCTIVFNEAMKTEMLAMPKGVLMHDHWLALIAYGIGDVNVITNPTILYRDHQQSVTKKNRLPFHERLWLSSVNLFGGSNYLGSEIAQVKLFKENYYGKLNDLGRYRVDRFLHLAGRNVFHRKYYSFMRYGHLKA